MIIITFYDIDYWDIAEILFDIASIIWFAVLLSIVLIVGFSKLTTFQIVKPLYYCIILFLNITVALCFVVYYAVFLSLVLSIGLYLVYDKYDIPNMIQMASKGATGLSEYKVRKQLEDYEKLTKEEQNEISNNVPSAERIKIHFFPWLMVTFMIPATISLIIRLVVGY